MSQLTPSSLLSEQDYRAQILDLVPRGKKRETLSLSECNGQVLAESLASKVDLPGFTNSAMDGYAVRAADTQEVPAVLKVIGEVAAGQAGDVEVLPGTAVRIMTGAPVPPGADAIIRVEATDGGTDTVTIAESTTPGADIREAGGDLRKGDLVGAEGDILRPGLIGLLAASGHDKVQVWAPARVAVVATGDELYPVGAELPPAGIYDSNSYQGAALVERAGSVVAARVTLTDDIDQAAHQLAELASVSDLIVTSGGVSAGAYEVVKEVFAKLGNGTFAKVALQPGKPQGHGTINGTPVLCLPGNPISSFVSFELFVRPLLRKMGGREQLDNPETAAATTIDLRRAVFRTRYLPAVLDWASMTITTPSTHDSHRVSTAAAANCLIRVPGQHELDAGAKEGDVIRAGSTVQVILLDRLT